MREANAKEAMRVKAEEEKQLVEFWNGVKECIDKRQIAGYRIPETVIIERNGNKFLLLQKISSIMFIKLMIKDFLVMKMI